MSDPLATNHLKLPYLAAAQAQKHVTHNEALTLLDTAVQLAVLDSTLTAPPGSPAEGDRHIVAASATDAWAGHDGEIATWVDGAWAFATAEDGWLAFDIAAAQLLVRLSGAWTPTGGSLGAITELGVNATADSTNRLAVKSEAVLFADIDAGDGGSGDIRVVVSKETDADTATFLFQSGFSGRAEIGLAGDTDFSFKVSPDGTTWTEAIRIDKDTGLATILYDNSTSGLTATNVQAAIDEVAAGGGGGDGAVASVFGRTGAVTAAASDYDASQVDNDSGVSGATVKDALDALDSGKQAADGDLTAIGALSPANDDVIQRKAGAWTNRTMAQVKADLALSKSDVGLGSVTNDAQLKAASNLSDLGSASTARTNLGLGGAATLSVGSTSGTVAAGDDSRITGAAQKSSNLSDLANAATAFGNIKQAADTSSAGVVELATVAEAGTGTDTSRAVTPAGLFPAQASVASGSTCNIGAAASSQVSITGTTTITAFDNVAAGICRQGTFAGALTLTHNATSLKLPGGANITTAANDRFAALSLGSGNWIVLWYQKADGTAVVSSGGGGTAASQSDQESASSTSVFVSPGRQQFHPSAAKCWAYITVSSGTPTLTSGYNITSITDTGVGECTVTIATDFSSASWAALMTVEGGVGTTFPIIGYVTNSSYAAGSVMLAAKSTSDSYGDPVAYAFAGFGDQ